MISVSIAIFIYQLNRMVHGIKHSESNVIKQNYRRTFYWLFTLIASPLCDPWHAACILTLNTSSLTRAAHRHSSYSNSFSASFCFLNIFWRWLLLSYFSCFQTGLPLSLFLLVGVLLLLVLPVVERVEANFYLLLNFPDFYPL